MDSYHNIAVVGAGPAGMMAAIRAAHLTTDIALFEKNASMGRKLGLTGKGRCNLTHEAPLEEFLEHFGNQGPFLRNAFGKFFIPELKVFFEKRGLRLKTERQGRIFPATDSSLSVIEIFKKDLKHLGVDIHLSSSVKHVVCKDQEAVGIIESNGQEFRAKKIIMATGGASYPQTGSTGDGFRIAEELGHKIQELRPGLVPLETQESFVKDLRGLTLKNIRIIFEEIESPIGELLFTHFGVSGPLVLDLSFDVDCLLSQKGNIEMFVDLKPALSLEQLDEKLQREFQQNGSLKIKNYLSTLSAKRLIPIFLKLCHMNEGKKCHQVTAVERRRLMETLKKFPLTIKGTRPLSEAMVTHGGVSLKEVDPKTMESKKIKGVYFCGEVLDLAAPSGGYNLQAAFATGYLAGESAAQSLNETK